MSNLAQPRMPRQRFRAGPRAPQEDRAFSEHRRLRYTVQCSSSQHRNKRFRKLRGWPGLEDANPRAERGSMFSFYIYREREREFFFNQVPLTFIPHVSFPNKLGVGEGLGWRITRKAEQVKMPKVKGKTRGSEQVFGGRWEGSRRRATGLHVLWEEGVRVCYTKHRYPIRTWATQKPVCDYNRRSVSLLRGRRPQSIFANLNFYLFLH